MQKIPQNLILTAELRSPDTITFGEFLWKILKINNFHNKNIKMNFRFEFLDPKTYYKLSSKLSESVKIKSSFLIGSTYKQTNIFVS